MDDNITSPIISSGNISGIIPGFVPPAEFGGAENKLQSYEPQIPPVKPALPRKTHQQLNNRKKSQYDNVFEASPGANPNPGANPGGIKSPLVNFLSSSQSFDYGGRDVGEISSRSHVLNRKVLAMDPLSDETPTISSNERRNSIGNAPPPLPPKKRDIINYMEILGKSLLPSSKIYHN